MSVLGRITSAILGAAGKRAAAAPTSGASATGASAPSAEPFHPIGAVDVEAVLATFAAQTKPELNWRRSIVDLMKLLNLDSSLAARKELARELRYSGDMNDLASMNVWLHKHVMQKLAELGGKVPGDLVR